MPDSAAGERCLGSCHCGAVRFSVPNNLGAVRYCYCVTCRKLSGAAFSVVARVPGREFELRQGSDRLAAYESSPGKRRYYCSLCHAPIYVRLDARPDEVRIRLGVLDGSPTALVTAHMWVEEKPPWYQIADDLPQFSRAYSGA